jgi:putative membrane protein
MRKEVCTLVAGLLIGLPAFAGSDVEFAKKAAMGGMLEVKLGEHAVHNAANPDVRAFGQRMVDDHSKAGKELDELAKKDGITVPTELDAEYARMAKDLLSQAGPAFDRSYMKMMVEDHQKVADAFRAEAKDGKTDIDRWAAQTLPTIESHLTQAREIEKRLQSQNVSRAQ